MSTWVVRKSTTEHWQIFPLIQNWLQCGTFDVWLPSSKVTTTICIFIYMAKFFQEIHRSFCMQTPHLEPQKINSFKGLIAISQQPRCHFKPRALVVRFSTTVTLPELPFRFQNWLQCIYLWCLVAILQGNGLFFARSGEPRQESRLLLHWILAFLLELQWRRDAVAARLLVDQNLRFSLKLPNLEQQSLHFHVQSDTNFSISLRDSVTTYSLEWMRTTSYSRRRGLESETKCLTWCKTQRMWLQFFFMILRGATGRDALNLVPWLACAPGKLKKRGKDETEENPTLPLPMNLYRNRRMPKDGLRDSELLIRWPSPEKSNRPTEFHRSWGYGILDY